LKRLHFSQDEAQPLLILWFEHDVIRIAVFDAFHVDLRGIAEAPLFSVIALVWIQSAGPLAQSFGRH
jgi:hypothetical protein